MNELITIITGLASDLRSVFIIGMVIVLLVALKWNSIVDFIKWVAGKRSWHQRTCGDCVLVLFGMREKYEYETGKLESSLLRSQMTYVEQRMPEMIQFLARSFNEDLDKLGQDRSEHEKLVQGDLYRETLTNALYVAKDEVRRSFKENRFVDTSEAEFSVYVKAKRATLIAIARDYMTHHYPQTREMIVSMRYRFNKMDTMHIPKMDEFAFDIFSNARDLVTNIIRQKGLLKAKLAQEIDSFVNQASVKK